jgi:hypothetical protein
MKWVVYSFIALSVLNACNTKPESNAISVGLPAEVLLCGVDETLAEVINRRGYRDSLLINAEAIPAIEYESGANYWITENYSSNDKYAHAIIVPIKKGESNDFVKALKNTSPEKKEKGFSIYANVWAKPQVVILFEYQDLEKDWNTHSQEIINTIADYEISMGPRGFYAPTEQTTLYGDELEKKFGMRLQIPAVFQIQATDSLTSWFVQDTRTFYQHILVSTASKLPANINEAVAERDKFIETKIKNEEGSRIIVSRSPRFKQYWKEVDISGKKCMQLSGWYAEEGTFRRGLFYRYYFPKGNEYVVLDEFAFAPDLPKSRFARLYNIIAHTYSD